MHILISGAGIAGLSLALALERRGIAYTVIERAPALRDAGYMIDSFGPGYDAAERLGVLSALERIHYPVARLSFLDAHGVERTSVPYASFRAMLHGRHLNFMRGDLERVLFQSLTDRRRVRFGVTLRGITQRDDAVHAEFSTGESARFDVAVGADGVHSATRALAFDADFAFVRFLGYRTLAFILPSTPAGAGALDTFVTISAPGRQVAVYPIRGNRMATFFLHRSDEALWDDTFSAAFSELQAEYGDMNWIVPSLIERADPATMYFDNVTQVVMPRWSTGRVALLGDACQCVSLLGGQGASMAMAAAYVLADEIASNGRDIEAALARYEARIKPAIERRQAAGRRIARWFVPDTRPRILLRNTAMRLTRLGVGRRMVRRFVAAGDDVPL